MTKFITKLTLKTPLEPDHITPLESNHITSQTPLPSSRFHLSFTTWQLSSMYSQSSVGGSSHSRTTVAHHPPRPIACGRIHICCPSPLFNVFFPFSLSIPRVPYYFLGYRLNRRTGSLGVEEGVVFVIVACKGCWYAMVHS